MRIIKMVVIALIAAALCSCSGEENRIDDYVKSDADFFLEFPAAWDGGDSVTAFCEKRGGNVTLEITLPDRSAGIKIDVAGENCSVYAGENAVPFSAEASEGLRSVIGALFPENYTVSSSDDGLLKILTGSCGSVYVGDGGIPCLVVCGEREILVKDFAPQ